MSEEKLYIDDGELVYYIKENEFIACDEIPMPMLEGIKHLQQKVEQLESMRKEAIEYMKEFIFEPLLISEDRKLIMFNENLKNFENILKKGDNNAKD